MEHSLYPALFPHAPYSCRAAWGGRHVLLEEGMAAFLVCPVGGAPCALMTGVPPQDILSTLSMVLGWKEKLHMC